MRLAAPLRHVPDPHVDSPPGSQMTARLQSAQEAIAENRCCVDSVILEGKSSLNSRRILAYPLLRCLRYPLRSFGYFDLELPGCRNPVGHWNLVRCFGLLRCYDLLRCHFLVVCYGPADC